MSPERIVAGLLGVATLLAWVRLASGAERGSAAWRRAVLFGAQPLLALALYGALFGGTTRVGPDALVVATAGAPRLVRTAANEALVALPEATDTAGATRVPDLATALRRQPQVTQVRIVGDGLPERDRPAARQVTLRYAPPRSPRGVVALVPPPATAPGEAFTVAMRTTGSARLTLVDPAGRIVDAAAPDGAGRLSLTGVARSPGAVLFAVRDGARVVASVPVVTRAAAPARTLILAGAPGPEVKFLRRWASDAGLAPAARLPVGGGTTLGDVAADLSAANLARTDLAILDDRSWNALGAASRAQIAAAVRGGMGLVVRLGGPVPRGWQVLGLAVTAGAGVVPLRLPPAAPGDAALAARRGPGSRDAPAASAAPLGEVPDLGRLDVAFPGAIPLLRDARGRSFAAWRGVGRGRVAVTTLLDGFALVTSGNGDAYADLWSRIASTIGRGTSASGPEAIDPLAFVGERTIVCGVGTDARVVAPDGATVPLLPDPAAGGCAGVWPRMAGWYRIVGTATLPLYVQPADALPALRRTRMQAETAALVGIRSRPPATGRRGDPSQPSWRVFLLFLTLAGALWWFERARFGRGAGAGRRPSS